jgi:hypothetical protein
VNIMLARLKSPLALAALAAVPAAFAFTGPSTSQVRAPAAGAAFPGAAVTLASMQGPTAFGYLEFDWNGTLPGFSPWQGDATTAELFPRQANATE